MDGTRPGSPSSDAQPRTVRRGVRGRRAGGRAGRAGREPDQPDLAAEPDLAAQPEPVEEAEPEPAVEAEPEPAAEAEPEAAAEAEPEPEPEPARRPRPRRAGGRARRGACRRRGAGGVVRRPLVVGLTGGIGSGKSEALAAFRRHGASVLSSDEVVRELYRRPDVIRAVAEHFGPQALDAGGSVDRARVAERVFADAGQRTWLESLLLPLIAERFSEWRDAEAAAGALLACSRGADPVRGRHRAPLRHDRHRHRTPGRARGATAGRFAADGTPTARGREGGPLAARLPQHRQPRGSRPLGVRAGARVDMRRLLAAVLVLSALALAGFLWCARAAGLVGAPVVPARLRTDRLGQRRLYHLDPHWWRPSSMRSPSSTPRPAAAPARLG